MTKKSIQFVVIMTRISSGEQIVVETHEENVGACGFEVTMMRRRDHVRGGAFILLKGGLTDINTVSLKPLAEAIIEASDGGIGVGTVSTIRPTNPLLAIRGLKNARKQRSQSMHGAIKHVVTKHQPDVLVAGGQSEGGVSAVDGTLHHKKKSTNHKTRLGSVTIDAPGVYGPFVTGMHVIEGLYRLIGNCLPDIHALSWRERFDLVRENLRHHNSPFELAYIIKEIEYLSDEIDISSHIETLRTDGVQVGHIFHKDDIVPGAEIPSDHARVLEGAHVRIVHEPEPAADYMIEFTSSLMDKPYSRNAA